MELKKEWKDYLLSIGFGESHLPYIEKAIDILAYKFSENLDEVEPYYITFDDAVRICGYKTVLYGVACRLFSSYCYAITIPTDGHLCVCGKSERLNGVFNERELRYLEYEGAYLCKIIFR